MTVADTRIDELRRRLDRDPGSRLFAQLAEELRKAGELEEAIGVARKGLEQHPAYPSARLTLGRALLDSGDPGAARAELETAVRGAPDNILANRLLGEALEAQGELEGALAQYQATLQVAPGDRNVEARIEAIRQKAAGGVPPAGTEITRPVPAAPPPATAEPAGEDEDDEGPAPTIRIRAPGEPPLAPRPPAPGRPAAGVPPVLPADARAEAPPAPDGRPGPAPASAPTPHPTPPPVPPPPPTASPAAPPAPPVPPPPETTLPGDAREKTAPPPPPPAAAPAPAPETTLPGEPGEQAAPPGPPPPVERAGVPREGPEALPEAEPDDSDLAPTLPRTEPPPTEEELPPTLPPHSPPGSPAPPPASPVAGPEPPPPPSAPPPASPAAPPPSPGPAAASASSTPFSSPTLAELYLQQGLLERAVEVYRQLVEEEPGNERARRRLAEVEALVAAAAADLPAHPKGAGDDREVRRRALERTIDLLEGLLAALRRR